MSEDLAAKNKLSITNLEERVKNFKNNADLARKSGNMGKAHLYDLKIAETNIKIQEIEKNIPLESNAQLREQLAERDGKIENLEKSNVDLKNQLAILNGKVDQLAHPEKYVVKPVEPEKNLVECTQCHRKIKPENMTEHLKKCKSGKH